MNECHPTPPLPHPPHHSAPPPTPPHTHTLHHLAPQPFPVSNRNARARAHTHTTHTHTHTHTTTLPLYLIRSANQQINKQTNQKKHAIKMMETLHQTPPASSRPVALGRFGRVPTQPIRDCRLRLRTAFLPILTRIHQSMRHCMSRSLPVWADVKAEAASWFTQLLLRFWDPKSVPPTEMPSHKDPALVYGGSLASKAHNCKHALLTLVSGRTRLPIGRAIFLRFEHSLPLAV